jgi:hypothetical protein
MYSTCLHCGARLGANEVLEAFPVGRIVAFDAARGRLWAVCPRCTRWNLAPLEERWEAVEAAERRFTDARLRVQGEGVGMAKLPDGTRLVRVGGALPGELAAWRYGPQLRGRRARYRALTGAAAVGGALFLGVGVFGALGAGAGLLPLGAAAYRAYLASRVVHRLGGGDSPTGAELLLKRHQLNRARLADDGAGGVAVLLPEALPAERVRDERGRRSLVPPRPLLLTGDAARTILTRTMVSANRKGAGRDGVDHALSRLSLAGGAEAFLRASAARGGMLDVPYLVDLAGPGRTHAELSRRGGAHLARVERDGRLDAVTSLAVEMALHEERERRALDGELAGLLAAWREAEEIAAIADSLFAPALPRKG